jgi:hypothetical protein
LREDARGGLLDSRERVPERVAGAGTAVIVAERIWLKRLSSFGATVSWIRTTLESWTISPFRPRT